MIDAAELLALRAFSDHANTDHYCIFNQKCGFAANKLAYEEAAELLPVIKGAAEVYLKDYKPIDDNSGISCGENEYSYYAPPHPLTAKRHYFERADILGAYYLLGKQFPLKETVSKYRQRALDLGFKNDPDFDFECLTINGKAIYRQLSQRHGLSGGYCDDCGAEQGYPCDKDCIRLVDFLSRD